MAHHNEILKGTLDLLILKALSWGPMHGYGVAQYIRRVTDGTLEIEDGALYPALHRMERRGWISSEWGLSENNRRAKYYAVTARGRRELARELSVWGRYADAVWKVVNATEEPA
ncbi:MAG TPA: PadR family transcriptional regulator [Longimicrobiales bacterium]